MIHRIFQSNRGRSCDCIGPMPEIYALTGKGELDQFENRQAEARANGGRTPGVLTRITQFFTYPVRWAWHKIINKPMSNENEMPSGFPGGHKIIEDRGILSGDMMDLTIDRPPNQNVFLASRGVLGPNSQF